jgi:ankyrin repeat protein
MAAAGGRLELVQLLIENGADASLSDDEGMTPSMIAVSSKRVPEGNLIFVIEFLNSLESRSAG